MHWIPAFAGMTVNLTAFRLDRLHLETLKCESGLGVAGFPRHASDRRVRSIVIDSGRTRICSLVACRYGMTKMSPV